MYCRGPTCLFFEVQVDRSKVDLKTQVSMQALGQNLGFAVQEPGKINIPRRGFIRTENRNDPKQNQETAGKNSVWASYRRSMFPSSSPFSHGAQLGRPS